MVALMLYRVASMAAVTWRRSTYCDTNACVEVARTGDGMALRSTLRPDVVLEFDTEQWRTFLAAMRASDR